MKADQDLAGLPEDVREALSYFAALFSLGPENPDSEYFRTIRAELLRLAHSESDLLGASKRLISISRNAEADLATIKQRIAEAPVAELRCRDATWILWPTADRGLGSLIGQHVALLPAA